MATRLQILPESIYAPTTNHQARGLERHELLILKSSSQGFGFTIADSPQGQRIKNVFAPDLCPNLLEGDIVLSVDGQSAQTLGHSRLVRLLQELPVGCQTTLVVARQASSRQRSRTPTAAFRYGEKQSNGNISLPIIPRSKTPAPNTHAYRSPYLNTTIPRNYGTVGSRPHDIYEDLQRLRLATPAVNGGSVDALQRHTAATPNYVPAAALSRSATNSSGAYAHDPRTQLLTVNLIRHNDGFGFRLVGGAEMNAPLQVGAIIFKGAAYTDGRLHEGDEIIEVDGHNVADGRHDQTVALIQQAARLRHVKLVVRRPRGSYVDTSGYHTTSTFADHGAPTPSLRAPPSHYDVHLVKESDDEGFGCTLITLDNNRFIGRIIANTPAERNGRLRAGDCIAKINGFSTHTMTHAQVIAYIKSVGSHITFTVDPAIVMPRSAISASTPNGLAAASSNGTPLANGGSQHTLAGDDNAAAHSHYGTLNGGAAATSNGNVAMGHGLGYLNNNDADRSAKLISVELSRGTKGFGFSIRGGNEYQMGLFILRIADFGPAAQDGRLVVGDELMEINGESTESMSHDRAIALIREQPTVRLLARRQLIAASGR